MKVALVTDGIFPYVIGGMQKHSFYMVKYLVKEGVQIDLYHTWINKEYDIEKLEFFSPEEKKLIRSFIIDQPKQYSFPGHYLLESYNYSRKLYDVLKNNLDGVDFIYVKGFAGWELFRNKSESLPPIGLKFHGLNMFQKPPDFYSYLQYLMFRPAVKYCIRKADYVFSYGGKISEITERIGVSRDRIIEVPTGIESNKVLDDIRYTTDIRKFIYIGRYERLKGIEELFQALKHFDKNVPFEFHFIGPIPEELRLKDDRLKYHGQINNPDKVFEILRNCDILVCPSYSEGMPNVIIEAMAAGLAVIATDVGAINYLVNEKNGWLLPSVSVSLIVNALNDALMLSNNQLDFLKEESQKRCKSQLTWETLSARLKHEIEKRINLNL